MQFSTRMIFVGTSGWAYPHWSGSFYPRALPATQRLAHYATQFPAVEVNVTCYRLATPTMVEGWKRATPDDFVFCFKGSRYITHMKRLIEPEQALERFFAPLEALRNRAGPVLWQLPPNFKCEPKTIDRLTRFFSFLPKAWRHAVEFRHPSWLENDQVQQLLTDHHIANVWISSRAMPRDTRCSTDFVFLRFHGLENGAHHHYTRRELEPWGRALLEANRPSFAFFNNDLNPHVARNALVLQELVEPHAATPSTHVEHTLGRGGWMPPDTWRPW